MPDRFARQNQIVPCLNQRAPSHWNLRLAEQLVRQNEKEQVRATVPNQRFELGAIEKPVLERASLTQDLLIAAMIDRFEIVGVELGKKRIRDPQRRVMRPQIPF